MNLYASFGIEDDVKWKPGVFCFSQPMLSSPCEQGRRMSSGKRVRPCGYSNVQRSAHKGGEAYDVSNARLVGAAHLRRNKGSRRLIPHLTLANRSGHLHMHAVDLCKVESPRLIEGTQPNPVLGVPEVAEEALCRWSGAGLILAAGTAHVRGAHAHFARGKGLENICRVVLIVTEPRGHSGQNDLVICRVDQEEVLES
jgi:hypothetical protein